MTEADIARRTEHPQQNVDLTLATRELMLAAATSSADDSDLVRAGELIAEATRLLEDRATLRVPRVDFRVAAEALATGSPYAMAGVNPASIPMDVSFDGVRARSEVTVNSLYEGPPDSVHGGTIGWLLDCITGILIQALQVPAVTGSLDLRYLRRTPLDAPLTLHSELVEHVGRKYIVEGWIEHEGERTAQARGTFISVNRWTR